jgi:HK97 family phage major capsid protein
MQTYAEQITAYEARRASAVASMTAIMGKSAEAGETLDSAQQEEYDTAEKDIEAIDGHLKRLKSLDRLNASTALAVTGATEGEGTSARGGSVVIVKGDNVPKGIRFARFVGAKYLASQQHVPAADIAKARWSDTPEVELALRAAVAAANTTDATNAGPLVVQQNLASEFAEYLMPATIIGRIPGLRRVPFNIKVPRATGIPTAYWVGEGQMKPLSAGAFDSTSLSYAKVAAIVPMTEELLRFSSPSAETIFRDELAAAITYKLDRDFLDPSKAADGSSPASLTNGVTAITPTGNTADALRDDLGTLLARYLAANLGVAGLVIVTTSTQAMRLSLMRNTLGQREFPDITVNGGFLEGIPVIVSENIAAPTGSPADGTLMVAINASEVMLADEGGIEIDVSREASLQMDTAPDSPATASTVMTSLWQMNMVAFKAERFITWGKRRSQAVQLISGANYQ